MTRAEAVSRAFLRLLKFDPDTHDIFDVRGPHKGVRITTRDGAPVQFIGYTHAMRLLNDEDNRRAMCVWIEMEDIDAPVPREEQADLQPQREDGDGRGTAAEAGGGDRLREDGGEEAARAEAAQCIGATPEQVIEDDVTPAGQATPAVDGRANE